MPFLCLLFNLSRFPVVTPGIILWDSQRRRDNRGPLFVPPTDPDILSSHNRIFWWGFGESQTNIVRFDPKNRRTLKFISHPSNNHPRVIPKRPTKDHGVSEPSPFKTSSQVLSSPFSGDPSNLPKTRFVFRVHAYQSQTCPTTDSEFQGNLLGMTNLLNSSHILMIGFLSNPRNPRNFRGIGVFLKNLGKKHSLRARFS